MTQRRRLLDLLTQRRRLLDLLWPMLQMLLDLLRQALLHLISLDIERAF
jgi:hypothetical protein